ncbi:uncharacterized protein [Centruroides vittatus]|uniref:uncharacterized protein n=1 Tax=Centruroides vittatus TaxID=120091 RepID=UPI00351039A4
MERILYAGYVITVCLTITFVTCRGAPRTHQEMVLCGRKIKLSSKEEPEVTAYVSHPFLDVTLGIVPQVEYTVNVHLSSRVTSSISKVALLSEGEFRISGDGYTICESSNGTIITNTVKGSFSLIWIPSHVQENSKIKLMILRSISEEEWVFHTDYYGWRNNCFQAMVPQGDLTYSDVRYLSNCSVFNIYPKSPPDSRQLVQFQDVLLSDEGYIALHLNSESFVDIIINSENLEEYRYRWIESLEGNLLIRFHSCQKCQFKIGTSFLDFKNGCIAVLNSQKGILTNPGKSLERECSIQILTDNVDEQIYLLIPKRKSSVTDQCADNYATVSLLVSGNITLCPGRKQMNLLSTGVKLIITFRTSDLKIFYKSVKMCKNMTVTEESGNICSFGNYGECYYIINTPVGYGIDLDFIYFETGRSLNCEGNYMTIQDTEKLINFCGNMTDKTNKIQSAKNVVTLRMSMLQPMEDGRGFCAVYRAVVQNDSFTACDYGWVSGSYYCYKLFTMQADWKSSNEVCKDNGGHLASIGDIHVQELVNEILLTSAYLSPKTAVWIGGNDITYENCYEWSSGQMFQYTNWFPGWKQYGGYNAQPNDDGLANQDCIELRNTFRYPSKGEGVTDTFYWNDRDCDVHNAFICQKPRPGVSILEYAKPDCNRTVRLDAARDRDMITSPLYPDNYPANVKCFIHVIAPEGRLIDLQFNDFILEDHESCQYDYLTIEGGVEASGIHYCGDWRSRIKLLRQISTSNMLKILFLSDFSQSFRGFRAEVSLVPEKNPKSLCDNHLFHSHEHYCYLVSTYPEVSWDTANRICTETQSQLATVTSTEEKKFLHSLIRSAEGYMSGVIYWIGSKKKSGEITWNWLNGERISSDIINLDENSALNQPSCLAIQWRHHNVTSDLFWSGKRCNHSGRYICKKLAFVLPDNLNTTLKNNSGRLTSVNFPAHYTSNMHYVMKIESNPASRIVINLDHLEVEWQEDCLYDYLEITERLDERGKRFCGSVIDEKSNYVSEQSVVYLVFHSDYSMTGSGFVLRWESVIGDSCGELHKTSSYIVLPSSSRRYLPGLDCFFNLSSSSRILITLTHFHVGSQDGQGVCSNDYLKISLDQSQTIILCGNSTSVPMGLTFLSYREVLDFHFHTNSGTTLGNTGFNITWRIWNHSKVESYARHEKITSNMGDLYSLNFPLDPPMNVDFIQNLIVPLGYRINSIYLHHDLQTRGCEGKIVIEDPYGETFNIICPSSKLYRNISSTLNILRFFSTTSFLKHPIKYHISYNITTDPGYIHKTLKIHSVYSCMPNPCLHGGSCIQTNKSQCNCTGSYTGVFCHLQWCETQPCGERGVCQTVPDGYRCSCPPEYTGSSCEEPITPCNANPCGPHGQCSVFNDTFKCHCQLWYEGSHCERFVFRIIQKPLSQRMLEEPFWLGLITVFAVLLVILCVYCIKRKFAEKIERLLAEEIEKSKCNPSPPAARYSLSSNQLSLTPGSQSPQTCPKSLFTKFRKYSIRSTTSGISPTDREHSRTFSFDDILRRSTKKTSSGPTDNNKKDDEKSRILASLVMSPQTRRMSLDEFIRMSERKIQEANREEEQKTCNSPESESIQETSFSARLSPRFARHSAPSFTEFHSIREQSVEYASSTESEEDPKTSQIQADITPPPQTTQEDKEISDKKKAPDPSAIQKTGFLEVPTILLPTPTTPDNPEKERTSENPQSPVRKKPEFLVGRKYSVDLPMPKILVTSNTSSIESDPNSPPRTPNPAKSMAYLTPLTADRTISESNLSTSGYSSLSSPGLSRCNSSSPISDDLENQNANTKKVSPPHKWHNHPKCHQTQQIVATLTEGEQPQYKTRTFTNALWRAPNRKTCHHDRCMKRHSYQTSTDESIDDEGIGMDPIDFKIRKGEVKSARELEAYITKKTPLINFTSSDTSTSSPTTRTSPNLRKGDKIKKTGTKGRKSPVASPTSVSASETTAEGNANVAHSSDSDQEYQRPKTQTRRTKKDGTSSPRITEGRRSVSSEKLGSKQTRNDVARCNSSTAIPQIITENFDFTVAKDKKSNPRSSAEKGLSVDDSIESSVPSDTDEEKTMEPLLPSESLQSNLRRQEALVEESDSADSSSETTVLLRKERTSIPELEEAGTQTDLTSAVVVYPGDEALLNVS